MNWTTIENAIHAWIVNGAQLPPEKVIWAAQRGPVPADPFVLLRLADLRAIGRDGVDTANNPTPTPGNELVVTVRGSRALRLSVQTFGGTSLGDTSDLARLQRVLMAATLPTVRDALGAAGVGLGPIGGVTVIDGDRNGMFEPRAAVDVEIYVASELAATGTFIEHLEVENLLSGETLLIDRPLDPP